MKNISFEKLSLGGGEKGEVPCHYAGDGDSENLIVFLPPARPARRANLNPYIPRVTWSQEMTGCECLYLGDPNVDAEWNISNGSWWLDGGGNTLLHEVSDFILSKKKSRVLAYGSSMGGYAALILASIAKIDAIAECPQIDLYSFPGSKKLLGSLGYGRSNQLSEHNVFSFWRESGPPEGSVDILLNIGDSVHIKQLCGELLNSQNGGMLKGMDAEFNVEMYSSRESYGHAVLGKNLALKNINRWVMGG